jgi:hypothetical protein
MSKDPSDPGVALRITELCGEGTIGTTWPQIHLHGHFSMVEQLDPVTERGL